MSDIGTTRKHRDFDRLAEVAEDMLQEMRECHRLRFGVSPDRIREFKTQLAELGVEVEE